MGLITHLTEVNNKLFWARFTTLLITIVAAFFALYTGELVAILGVFGWGTFAAAIVPAVCIGFNWKRATPLAANVAILSSLIINMGFKLFGIQLPYNIDTGAFSLLVSIALFLGLSLLAPKVELQEDIERTIDL